MIESIIHIFEMLIALGIYSLIAYFAYRKTQAANNKSDKQATFAIRINTDPARYWAAAMKDRITDANDLRHWDAEIEVARRWRSERGISQYMTAHNIPGNIVKCPIQ